MMNKFLCICAFATVVSLSAYAEEGDPSTQPHEYSNTYACNCGKKKKNSSLKEVQENQFACLCDEEKDPKLACCGKKGKNGNFHHGIESEHEDDDKLACCGKKSKKGPSHHGDESEHEDDDKLASCASGKCSLPDDSEEEPRKIA